MLSLQCPNCESSIKEGDFFCIHCGAKLHAPLEHTVQQTDTFTPTRLVKEGDDRPQVSGIGCYECGGQAVGQCKKSSDYYCRQHGDSGYCEDCLRRARGSTPGGIGFINFMLNGLAAIVLLIVFYVSMLLFGFDGGGNTSSALLILPTLVTGFSLAVIGLPVFLMSRALRNGSGMARTSLVVISWTLVLLVPTVIGPIVGIVSLILVNQKPTQQWFEMRAIARNFPESTRNIRRR